MEAERLVRWQQWSRQEVWLRVQSDGRGSGGEGRLTDWSCWGLDCGRERRGIGSFVQTSWVAPVTLGGGGH